MGITKLLHRRYSIFIQLCPDCSHLTKAAPSSQLGLLEQPIPPSSWAPGWKHQASDGSGTEQGMMNPAGMSRIYLQLSCVCFFQLGGKTSLVTVEITMRTGGKDFLKMLLHTITATVSLNKLYFLFPADCSRLFLDLEYRSGAQEKADFWS